MRCKVCGGDSGVNDLCGFHIIHYIAWKQEQKKEVKA